MRLVNVGRYDRPGEGRPSTARASVLVALHGLGGLRGSPGPAHSRPRHDPHARGALGAVTRFQEKAKR
jgi:hypothetical protein